MPRGTTKRILTAEQRAAAYHRDEAKLFKAEQDLSRQEWDVYYVLLIEADEPEAVADRLAILDRAKATVANQAPADRER